MKTYTEYSNIPGNAIYLGSEHGDGTIEEATDEALNEAINPVKYRDPEGVHHFFDLVG